MGLGAVLDGLFCDGYRVVGYAQKWQRKIIVADGWFCRKSHSRPWWTHLLGCLAQSRRLAPM